MKAVILLALAIGFTVWVGVTEPPPDSREQNRDPRAGYVYLDHDACSISGCRGPWKRCIGHDLYVRIGGELTTTRGSGECEPPKQTPESAVFHAQIVDNSMSTPPVYNGLSAVGAKPHHRRHAHGPR